MREAAAGSDVDEKMAALITNSNAIRAIASAVEGTLGPKGLDTMLVDKFGEVVITNDGVTILTMMEANHPAARMLISILAAGWFASIMVSMVTPSLVITTSPNLSTSMVSSPFGPSVPSTALAIARIALELVIKAAIFSSTSDPAAASLIKLNGSNLLSSPAQYHPVEGPGQIFRQVIHYTDHFSVIHPGRAKHADGADLAAAQGVGRGNHAVIPDIVVFDLSAYSDRYDFITALA